MKHFRGASPVLDALTMQWGDDTCKGTAGTMDKSVPTIGAAGSAVLSRPMATYMPSLGSRAPMFAKSSLAFDDMIYGVGDFSPKPSPTNPPVTPWDETEDHGRVFSPARSPVNMLLATDLSEVVDGRGRRVTDLAPPKTTSPRWPFLKQQAARHVYGNLRAKLQNREPIPPPAVCMTYVPNDDHKPLDGIQIQTFGIKPRSDLADSSPADDVTKLHSELPKVPKTLEKKNYRISFKLLEGDPRGCLSAPPPTAESAGDSKPNSSEGPASKPHQPRRSRTAREYYRPKKDRPVKFDSVELPKRLQQEHRPPSSSPNPVSRVTWMDVMAAKSDGVYRDSPDGLGRRKSQNSGSQVKLYLSSELWGILDEDINAIKTVAGKS